MYIRLCTLLNIIMISLLSTTGLCKNRSDVFFSPPTIARWWNSQKNKAGFLFHFSNDVDIDLLSLTPRKGSKSSQQSPMAWTARKSHVCVRDSKGLKIFCSIPLHIRNISTRFYLNNERKLSTSKATSEGGREGRRISQTLQQLPVLSLLHRFLNGISFKFVTTNLYVEINEKGHSRCCLGVTVKSSIKRTEHMAPS